MNHHRLALLALAALLPFGATAQQMPLNDTGQERCYDGTTLVACTEANTGDTADHPRQDGRFGRDAQAGAGQLAKTGGGNAGFDFAKLDTNGDELSADAADWSCVRDNVTGRVWEVKTDDDGLRDRDWTYTWYDSTATNPGTPDGGSGQNGNNCADDTRCDTEKFVADVNGAQLCGYTDWRLPSRRELLSIINHDTRDPAIDTDYFPNTVSRRSCWSTDSFAPDPGLAWVVDLSVASTGAGHKAGVGCVRLVRGGQPADLNTCPGQTDYTDNGDGTVTDNGTGLIWDRCSWGQTLDNGSCTGTASTHNWQAALGMAVTANTEQHLDHDDWRLPNPTELESLVDPACSSPAINTDFFPDTPGTSYWSSTTSPSDPRFAWGISFGFGNSNSPHKSNGHRFRLVRGGQSFDALTSYAIDITIEPPDGGTAGCEPNPVPVGGSSTCTATPESGYAFLGWSDDCAGETCELSNVTEAQSVTASFALIVNGQCGAADGGLFTEAPSENLCDAGTASTVDESAVEFTWSCQGANTGSDAQCRAERGHTVTPSAGANGSIDPDTEQVVAYNDTAAFTVTPDPDYKANVGGSCGGTLVGDTYTTEPITEDCTVEAEFVQVSVSGDSPTGSGPIRAEVSGGGSGCGFERGEFVALDSVATPPAFVEFPHGLFDFELSGCEVGATATLTVIYPEPLPSGAVYWKFGPTADDPDPHWYQRAATLDGSSASFDITDGQTGDGDLEANGRIVDPSGPGVLRLPPVEPKPIPTLQVWGLLLLAGLLGLIGMRQRRRAGG